MRPRQHRSIDGFVHRPTPRVIRKPAPKPASAPPKPPQQSLPAKRVYAKPLPPSVPKKRLPSWLETVLFITLAIAGGILVQSAVFGQLAIVAYGFAALIWRIPSNTTFALGLTSMLATIILLVWQGNAILTQNFATYSFLLLVVGVISLGRELKKEGGRIYSIRQQNKY
jgi:hypothetical protein